MVKLVTTKTRKDLAVTECTQQTFEFQGLGKRKVTADFSGGYLSSDGGGLLLRETELKLGLIDRLAGCFTDGRDQRYVEHSLPELLRQRIFGLSLGYEDLNDHDRLRLDPVHALLAGKKDAVGSERSRMADRGAALAGHATLNRLELGAETQDGRYKKIMPCPEKIEELLIREGVKAIPRRSREIVLDFDATDDPLHGQQEGAYFHGYYKAYCYLPLYCFCGSIPLWAELRDCKRDASAGTVDALKKIIPIIRERFGRKVRIIVRGDSGFARDEIMAWCEDEEEVYYCFGLARNNRLSAELKPLFEKLDKAFESGSESIPCRRFKDFEYRTLNSWSCSRRVIGKAEVLAKGRNPRFIVTNLPVRGFEGERTERFSAIALYEQFYCARGNMENRIKEEQLDLYADRTSTHWLSSNQLRLWFSAFAHLILSVLRAEVLKGTALADATIGQIRLKLFKIGARVKVSCRRIHFELVSAYPWQNAFARAHRQSVDFFP
ncbi:MAG: IS1380 family transposase [Verrucomicrobiota bacterium]